MSERPHNTEMMPIPADEASLDELLSRPSKQLVEALARMDGHLLILGVSGKMGPTFARMARRAGKRVVGAARFSDAAARAALEAEGIETVPCDLLDRASVAALPNAPNVLYLAGLKFGATNAPARMWAMNTLAPAHAAERFANSRLVAVSSGCVYPLTEPPGASEGDALEPLGEYANACVARERLFEHFSRSHRTALSLARLNYAVELRYGVLLDIAQRVYAGEPIDLSTGHVNVIWQRDACDAILRCFEHASSPPFVINIAGAAVLSVREIACKFGERLGRPPLFSGSEAPTSLLSNAARMEHLLGAPPTTIDEMIDWVSGWVLAGGSTLGKPTHYETRDGRF